MAKYSDDFSGGTAGSYPLGWSVIAQNGSDTDYGVFDDAALLGGKGLRYNYTGSGVNANRAIVFDAPGGSIGDCDLLIRMKPLTTSDPVSLQRRVDDNNWLYGGMNDEASDSIRARSKAAGTVTATTAALTALVAGNWYYHRVKITGDTVETAIWPVAHAFPGFQVSHTTSGIAAGSIAFTGFYTGQVDIDWFSVGTGTDTADNLDSPTVTPETRKGSTFVADKTGTLGTVTTATLAGVNVVDHLTAQDATTATFAGAFTDEITTSGEYSLVLGDGTVTEATAVQVNVYGVVPSNNPWQKDGSALASLSNVQYRVVAGADLNGTELFYTGTGATDVSGNIPTFDVSDTAAADADAVHIVGLTANGESIVAPETVELI